MKLSMRPVILFIFTSIQSNNFPSQSCNFSEAVFAVDSVLSAEDDTLSAALLVFLAASETSFDDFFSLEDDLTLLPSRFVVLFFFEGREPPFPLARAVP